LSGKTILGYDPAGRITSLTDPLNRTTSYTYDPAGRVVTTSYGYGAAGRLASSVNGTPSEP
jgi:YD repeat-containing protein